jgi:hypothetical protein
MQTATKLPSSLTWPRSKDQLELDALNKYRLHKDTYKGSVVAVLAEQRQAGVGAVEDVVDEPGLSVT